MNIFISYSRKNREEAKVLAQDLQALGHAVWLDQELTGGQNWWEQILSRIRRCDVFVVVLASEALKSTACARERDYATQLRKRILPVLLADDVNPKTDLPPALSAIEYVDYRRQDKQALAALNKAFANLPNAQPLPDPLPNPPPVPISYLSNLKDEIEGALPPDLNSQRVLVSKLKDHLDNEDDHDDVVRLLRNLRQHPNLLAKVASEIDALLAQDTGFAAKVTAPQNVAAKKPEQTSGPADRKSSDKTPAKRNWWKWGFIVIIIFIVLCAFLLLSSLSSGQYNCTWGWWPGPYGYVWDCR